MKVRITLNSIINSDTHELYCSLAFIWIVFTVEEILNWTRDLREVFGKLRNPTNIAEKFRFALEIVVMVI